jgi:hypothetical protein
MSQYKIVTGSKCNSSNSSHSEQSFVWVGLLHGQFVGGCNVKAPMRHRRLKIFQYNFSYLLKENEKVVNLKLIKPNRKKFTFFFLFDNNIVSASYFSDCMEWN